MPLSQIEGQLIFLSNPSNYVELNFLKVVEDDAPITAQTQLSVRKIVDGFAGFGFQDEGRMVEQFLKGIGAFDNSSNDHVFTPADISEYLETLRTEMDPYEDCYLDNLYRGLQRGNFQDISSDDMAAYLSDHKIYLSK